MSPQEGVGRNAVGALPSNPHHNHDDVRALIRSEHPFDLKVIRRWFDIATSDRGIPLPYRLHLFAFDSYRSVFGFGMLLGRTTVTRVSGRGRCVRAPFRRKV